MRKILDTAERLFIEKGYERTSLQDIITETGLSKGAIYHHFTSKEGIFYSVCDRIGQRNGEALSRVRDNPSLNGLEKLRAMFKASLQPERQAKMFCMMPYLMDNAKFLATELRSIFTEVVPFFVEPIIRQGMADGSIRTEHPKELAEAMIILADGWINPIIQPTTPEEIRACRGSSFQVPPTLAVLNRALQEDRYHAIGVVGTPCKTLAVYKMKANPLPENDNHAGNIGMVFGLFCGWGLDWDGLNALAAKHADPAKVSHMDIPPSKYHSLELREDGETVSVNLDEVTPLVRSGCRYCADMTAEFADLSIGGARSAGGWEVDKGWNQIIVRSEKGEALLKLAQEKGVLEFKEAMEGGLEKLKKASLGKRRTAVKNLRELTGKAEDLGYLNPSRELFQDL